MIIAVIILILIILIALTLWLPSFVMGIKPQTLSESFEWQTAHYDTSFYEGLVKDNYTVKMKDGYIIHAELLRNPEPSTEYVIITHGYTDNRMGALKYAKVYLALGYNCIIYDLRGHGENEPTFTTYGIREGEDLNSIIEDSRARYPDMTRLGLHGESLGAGTTVSCLKYAPDIDFAAADCGFSDIENVLKGIAPDFLIDLADIGARLRYRYAIKDMRPIDSLDENEIPVLFIHGADDTLISPKNSEDMSKRTKGVSELHIIAGAEHAMSVLTAPEEYYKIVKEFLEKEV